MAYDNLLDPETGFSIGTIEGGKILNPDRAEVGSVVDGVAYGADGEVWGPLGDARAQTGAAPMPEAMRRALKREP